MAPKEDSYFGLPRILLLSVKEFLVGNFRLYVPKGSSYFGLPGILLLSVKEFLVGNFRL